MVIVFRPSERITMNELQASCLSTISIDWVRGVPHSDEKNAPVAMLADVMSGGSQEKRPANSHKPKIWRCGLKRAVNSYSTRAVSAISYAPTTTIRFFWWIPQVPNYVWLAMIILTVSALSVSTLVRSQEQEREAKSSYSYFKTRVENAKGVNLQIKAQTEQIKNNPRVATQAAQDQLRLVRPNEVVVAVP
jgi:hypothetical protein